MCQVSKGFIELRRKAFSKANSTEWNARETHEIFFILEFKPP